MKRSRRVFLVLIFVVLATGWLFRSKVLRLLAPIESDFTRGSRLSPEYPRPGANLTPVWRVEVEPGYGGAAIAGGDVFVLDREAGVADTLRVLDVETGAETWTFSYPAPGRLEFQGSRTTPVVVDDLVYISGSFGQVHCIDRRTHEPIWSIDLEDDCGGERPDFGFAASPLVHGTLVILPALGPDVGLIAFDRFTGAAVWRTAPLGYSYSEPVVLHLLGQSQVVFLTSDVKGLGSDEPVPNTVTAFDPARGTELWRVRTLGTSVTIPSPVQVDDEHFFLTGGYGGGSTLMRIRRYDDAYAFEEVFHVAKGSQLHPPVIHKDHIYLVANENSNESVRRRHRGGLTCFDLTGRELWSTGADPYLGRGHMLVLGDYLLIQDGQTGILRLCHASPRGFSLVATANVFNSPARARDRMWAKMSREDSTLIVRGRTELLCVRLGDRSGEER